MKKLIIIVLITILQSCSDGYIKERDFILKNKAIEKNKTIILVRIVATEKSLKLKDNIINDGFTEMNWCKDEEQKKCKEIFYASPYIIKKSYGQLYRPIDIYEIKAGTYYLDKVKELKDRFTGNISLLPLDLIDTIGVISPIGNTPNFNTSPLGWNKKLNAPNFASFEAKAGEIVYIGDLFFTFTKQKYWFKGKINLTIEDNYDQAVSYFKSQYPEYKDKPVIKRLAQPGVLLDNYDAGIFW